MLFSPQIPLQLDPRRPDRFEDFIAGPNEHVLEAIKRVLDEPGCVLFLSGPEGSGKSHLLNALCNVARGLSMGAFYIALKTLPEEAAAGLSGLQGLDLVCVDDIDHAAGKPVWETALFHCFNDVRAAGGRLVVGSRQALPRLEFGLPDLQSRLAWGLRLQLQRPDDQGKLQILERRALGLGIDVPAAVFDYLIKHGRRDMGSLLTALDGLKDAAIAGKRRITIPLAREVLSMKDLTYAPPPEIPNG